MIFVLALTLSFEAAASVGIIFFGDSGDISPDKTRVAKAVEKYCATEVCSAGLLLGDNFYETGVAGIDDTQFNSKFEASYKNLRFIFYPVLGNHDALGNWQAEIDYKSDHWVMPSRYYTLDKKILKLYALDTNLYTAFDATLHPLDREHQHEWITKQLSEATSKWKIVYGHHPVYSSGMHGDTELMIKYLQPLLEQHKVDFYISGHDHNKELQDIKSTKYIICGTGARLREITPTKNSIFAKSSLGFGHLLLTENTARIRFIDDNGITEFEKTYHKGAPTS